MFMWKYFILYFGGGVVLGFMTDYSDDSDNANTIAGVLALVIIGFLVWNFLTFGIGWGVISAVEAFAGITVAVTIKGANLTK